jgi:pyruvate dehydrogenase kinase 2/3/4
VQVAKEVIRQTNEFYGICPDIEIVDCMKSTKSEHKDFTYVPHHLHYMLGEILKNSCRATVQHSLNKEIVKHEHKELFPIRVVIVKGDEDVTIKIADRGGGIPRSVMAKIWKFGHTIEGDESESDMDFGSVEGAGARIRGFGLPLARIYARYFGGDLSLKSMEGYGVDAYLHLPRLGDACENLPVRVRASPGELDSMPNTYVRN